ncbi:hypothetical protein [uncultured Planktosalinus sp.]|uniref:hypothetical protein n=1 Tax=uncultured Planktosalinus sp. TaxID=1810935 RepID=UPI0030DCF56E
MKHIQLIFLFILCTSCSKNDDNSDTQNKLYGTWKHTESYISEGGPGFWVPVDNGFTYTFSNSNELVTTGEITCVGELVFHLNQDLIDFYPNCTDFNLYLIPSMTYKIAFGGNNVISLVPEPLYCDEGCGYKLLRVQPD